MTTDTRERRIPNALTMPLAMSGLALGAASSGMRGLLLAIAGFLVAAIFFLVPTMKFGWGMGDLKFAAALGALGGPLFAVWMCLYAMVAGGVFAVLWLAWHQQRLTVAGDSAHRSTARTGQLARSGLAIPFALPIVAGAAFALLVVFGAP